MLCAKCNWIWLNFPKIKLNQLQTPNTHENRCLEEQLGCTSVSSFTIKLAINTLNSYVYITCILRVFLASLLVKGACTRKLAKNTRNTIHLLKWKPVQLFEIITVVWRDRWCCHKFTQKSLGLSSVCLVVMNRKPFQEVSVKDVIETDPLRPKFLQRLQDSQSFREDVLGWSPITHPAQFTTRIRAKLRSIYTHKILNETNLAG